MGKRIVHVEEEKHNYHGISLLTILSALFTVIFVVLKLTKVISWSWLWVLIPIWISILL